jgi:hypothetical protein
MRGRHIQAAEELVGLSDEQGDEKLGGYLTNANLKAIAPASGLALIDGADPASACRRRKDQRK